MAARKLAKNVYVGETLYTAGSTPPKDVADQITNPAAWGNDSDAAADPEPEGNGYGDMKPADLAQLAEERGLEVEGTGANGNVKKSDLVAALEAADAAAIE